MKRRLSAMGAEVVSWVLNVAGLREFFNHTLMGLLGRAGLDMGL
jgi:hypothetical protein